MNVKIGTTPHRRSARTAPPPRLADGRKGTRRPRAAITNNKRQPHDDMQAVERR